MVRERDRERDRGRARPVARILSIAGSDSGGGAGIQADIKTITLLGGHAMTAITAVTAQNSMGVERVLPMSSAMVRAQADAVLHDFGVDAVKIGMLGSADNAAMVADWLEGVAATGPGGGAAPSPMPIVFDPVMVATSGATLADTASIAMFTRLAMIATVTTPNLPEWAVLGGEAWAEALAKPVLLKGGHGDGDTLVDRLFFAGRFQRSWTGTRIATRASHGTGCTLSSAIACRLAQGAELEVAVTDARAFVRRALTHAPDLGQGNGPMGHGLWPREA